MRRVSLTGLRAFERVVSKGSQRAAAEDLGVTQTAISHAIKSLEAQLNLCLFTRDGNAYRLTRSGEALANELRPAFERIDRAVESAAKQGDEITLSTTPAFAACWLAPQLARRAADRNAPLLRIQATTDIAPLALGEAAMAVRYAAQTEGEHLTSEVFQVVVSRALESMRKPPENLPLIETRWARGRAFAPSWADWFEAAGEARPKSAPAVAFADEHQALQAALAGARAALISNVLAAPMLRQGALRVIRPDVALKGLSYWLMIAPERAKERGVVSASRWIRDRFAEFRSCAQSPQPAIDQAW